jgi:LuxR family transcriptional regulator of csgAB operon
MRRGSLEFQEEWSELRQLCVLGPSLMQNELLAGFFERSTQLSVIALNGSRSNEEAVSHPGTTLFLRDCIGLNAQALEEVIEQEKEEVAAGKHRALFNVEEDAHIEQKALACGLRGIFIASDDAKTLARGVRAMACGEYWFPRKTMSDFLHGVKSRESSPEGVAALTPRELEVLGLVAMGATNEAIADKFCLSVNTVKTHLYRIYKKIGVSNRLQALLWASQNL